MASRRIEYFVSERLTKTPWTLSPPHSTALQNTLAHSPSSRWTKDGSAQEDGKTVWFQCKCDPLRCNPLALGDCPRSHSLSVFPSHSIWTSMTRFQAHQDLKRANSHLEREKAAALLRWVRWMTTSITEMSSDKPAVCLFVVAATSIRIVTSSVSQSPLGILLLLFDRVVAFDVVPFRCYSC